MSMYYVIKYPGSASRDIEPTYLGMKEALVDDIDEAMILARDDALNIMAAAPFRTDAAGKYAELVEIRAVEC